MEDKAHHSSQNTQERDTSRAKYILQAAGVLIAVAAFYRVWVSPAATLKVAAIVLICLFAMHQIHQFLTGGLMLSKLGRGLSAIEDNKFERAAYFAIHVLVVAGGTYILVAGRTVIGKVAF